MATADTSINIELTVISLNPVLTTPEQQVIDTQSKSTTLTITKERQSSLMSIKISGINEIYTCTATAEIINTLNEINDKALKNCTAFEKKISNDHITITLVSFPTNSTKTLKEHNGAEYIDTADIRVITCELEAPLEKDKFASAESIKKHFPPATSPETLLKTTANFPRHTINGNPSTEYSSLIPKSNESDDCCCHCIIL